MPQADHSKEVELKAQSGDNSQLFMENSNLTQSLNNSMGGNYTSQQQQMLQRPLITLNLEDAVLQEAKLWQIVEVSSGH